jgi:transcriptional regulator with XRE-family HTH domain
MNKNIGEQITKKRKALKMSVPELSKLLNLQADSIYKWQKGTNPRNFEHSKKIEKFSNGVFDEYVINGKVLKDPDYYKTIPTLMSQFTIAELQHKIIETQKITIQAQSMTIGTLEKEAQKLAKTLDELKKNCKQVVSIKKTNPCR